MIRLVFPEISFTGRMSRGVFWRELALAALTTPIVIGLLTYLVNEFSVAAAQGLAVDDARAKVLAGFVLTGIGLRNATAFAGIVKRRMNDVGYGAIDFRRDSRPMLLAAGLVFVMLAGLPIGGLSVVLILPLFYIIIWQIKKLFSFAFRLIISSSHHGSEPTVTWRQEAQESPWGGLQTQLRSKEMKDQPIVKLLTALGEELNRLGRDEKAQKVWGEMKSAASSVPAFVQIESVRRWLDQPVVAGGEVPVQKSKSQRSRDRPRQKPVVYKSPSTNAVRVAHSLPKHGRSTWLSGLLRGPWG